MAVEIFHYQSPRKYVAEPESNFQPLDLQSDTYLQSDTLQTELRGPASETKRKILKRYTVWLYRMCGVGLQMTISKTFKNELTSYGPLRDLSWGLKPGKIQTSLLSYRD